jgi:hypothetical protein
MDKEKPGRCLDGYSTREHAGDAVQSSAVMPGSDPCTSQFRLEWQVNYICNMTSP